jgi:hypothetical protein
VTFENPFELNIKYDLKALEYLKIDITLKKNKGEDISLAVNL